MLKKEKVFHESFVSTWIRLEIPLHESMIIFSPYFRGFFPSLAVSVARGNGNAAGDAAYQGVCVCVCVSTHKMVLQYIYIQYMNGSFQSMQSQEGEGEVHSDTRRQLRGRWSTLTNTRDTAFDLLIDRWPLNDLFKVKRKKKGGGA